MNRNKPPKYPLSPFGFINYFIRPYYFYISIIFLITLLWAVHRTLEPYIIKIIVDSLEEGGSNQNGLFVQLRYPILIFIFLRLFMNLVSRLHDYAYSQVMPSFEKNIIVRMTKYIEKHSQSYFKHHFGGSLVSNISTLATTCRDILNEWFYEFVFPFFSLIFITITISLVNVHLAIILLVWTIIFVWVSYRLSIHIQNISEQLTEQTNTLFGKLLDSITNILAVQLFARRKYEISSLDELAQENVRKEKELSWSNIKLKTIMDIMANILIFVMIVFLVYERQQGSATIGDFALVLTLGLTLIDIVWDLSRHYMRFIENIGKSTQSLKTILIPHDIKDAKNAQSLNVNKGVIEFKNITFSPNVGKPLFDNLSLTIDAKEKVGIVGQSGSGKTTLLNLLVRLMDVDKGFILIDGQNIREVTQDSLHSNISFIPQEPILFHRTIAENIKYGKLDASEAEINEAAQRAYAEGFIKSLPHGYNTLVGEGGSTLSGGQRQRLAIARAVLKNSKILVLDEATSALDSETEHYIQLSLERLMQNKTVLVVAHRLSTLMKMDRIIVLDKGKIVESGTHKSLLQKKGIYQKYWNIQANKVLV